MMPMFVLQQALMLEAGERDLQPVYTTDREGRIRSGSTQIDLGSAFTLRHPSAPCTCDSGSKFMISDMRRPHSHETIVMFGNSIYNTMTTPRLETGPFVIWFGYYWQPSRPTNGFDSVYT